MPDEVEVKQAEELIALGGIFYAIDGESWCDTPLDTWKLVYGLGYVRVECPLEGFEPFRNFLLDWTGP